MTTLTAALACTIERQALQKALARLAGVVERRNTIPILANVLLRTEAGKLILSATDLDVAATTDAGAQADIHASTTVSAQTLADIVRRLPDGDIKLEVQPDGQQMVIRSGRSRFTINILPAADFPEMSFPAATHRFTLPSSELANLIASTSFAICDDEQRFYHLNGIYLHAIDGKLVAVATDGHRLSRAQRALPEGAAGMPGIILPRKTADTFRKRLDDSESVTIELGEGKIRATFGGTVVTSKLIDGTFPDYVRVIPQGNDKKARLVRRDLEAAADRVASVTGERGRAVKLAFQTNLGLTLTCRNAENGSAEETVDADWETEPFEIGFNARYLHDVCSVLPGEKVELALADPGSPALFSCEGHDDLLIVLMPMRV